MFGPNENPPTPFSNWRRWGIAGFIVIGLAVLAGILVGIPFGENRGWIAGGSVGALGVVIRFSWPLRKKGWFWVAMSGLTAVHIVAIAKLNWSWTHSWNGHSFSGFMLLDIVVMIGIIYGLYLILYGRPASAVADEPNGLPDYGDRDFDL
jgi:hypothetical protein